MSAKESVPTSDVPPAMYALMAALKKLSYLEKRLTPQLRFCPHRSSPRFEPDVSDRIDFYALQKSSCEL